MCAEDCGAAQRTARVLFFEFLFDDRYGRERSENLPFLLGQARAMGLAARWRLGAIYGRATTHLDRHTLSLADVRGSGFVPAVRDFDATHVIVPDRLADDALAMLAAEVPRTRFIDLHTGMTPAEHADCPADWLPKALGMPTAGWTGRWLVDAVRPAYDNGLVPPPEGKAAPAPPLLPLIAGPTCTYERKVAANRFYRDLPLPAGTRQAGCTFCPLNGDARYRYETPALELTVRQLLAAAATAERYHADSYQAHGALVALRIDEFFRALSGHTLPPSRFHFQYRIDELLRTAERLDTALALARESGHRIVLYNMGVENFSPVENERLNKGILPEQVVAAADRVERWRQEYPDAFEFGNFGLILFTPWTTLDDIALNYERIRSRRFPGIDGDSRMLRSKLQLVSGTAVAELARRDGVVVEAPGDFFVWDGNCIGHGSQIEYPWRFRHEEVADFYEVVRRVTLDGGGNGDDPLRAALRDLYESRPDRWRERVDFLLDALAVAREVPRPRGPAGILARLRERFPVLPGAAPGNGAVRQPPPAPRSAAERLLVARADRLRFALSQLASAPRSPLPGWRLESFEAEQDGAAPSFVASLACGADQRLTLRLLSADAPVATFAAAPRIKLAHGADTPLDTPAKIEGVRRLCAILDHYLRS